MSSAKIITLVAILLLNSTSEIYFAASLVFFIISSRHKKAGRDTRLAKANKPLKINLIISTVLFAVTVAAVAVYVFAFAADFANGMWGAWQ